MKRLDVLRACWDQRSASSGEEEVEQSMRPSFRFAIESRPEPKEQRRILSTSASRVKLWVSLWE